MPFHGAAGGSSAAAYGHAWGSVRNAAGRILHGESGPAFFRPAESAHAGGDHLVGVIVRAELIAADILEGIFTVVYRKLDGIRRHPLSALRAAAADVGEIGAAHVTAAVNQVVFQKAAQSVGTDAAYRNLQTVCHYARKEI